MEYSRRSPEPEIFITKPNGRGANESPPAPGRITREFFDKQSATWHREQDALLLQIQEIQKATLAPIDQAVDMLRLTSRASELFLRQPAVEQRRLLQIVVEKAAWQDSALRTTPKAHGTPPLTADRRNRRTCVSPYHPLP